MTTTHRPTVMTADLLLVHDSLNVQRRATRADLATAVDFLGEMASALPLGHAWAATIADATLAVGEATRRLDRIGELIGELSEVSHALGVREGREEAKR